MRRFTDTEKWKDPWFRSLKGAHKLVFLFLVDNCNNAGFYEMDMDMMTFQIGIDKAHIEGALKALERGIKGASGWLWIRRFLRHQKNDDLNPHNPAHRQILSQVKDQADRFSSCPEFLEFIAPFKGLLSPIGIGKVQVQVGESVRGFKKPSREEALAYGHEIGMQKEAINSWYDHFESNGWRVSGKTPMKDWKAAMRNGKRIAPSLRGQPKASEKFRVV